MNDTDTIALSEVAGSLEANVILSLQSGNGLQALADGLYVQSPVAPLEAWHILGAGGEPAYQNSWMAYAGLPGFFIDTIGIVHLRGSVAGGSPVVSTIFTLPVGYRPAQYGFFSTVADGPVATMIKIYETTGNVSVVQGGAAGWTSLEGITFRAA
jgi:hypothetical protein